MFNDNEIGDIGRQLVDTIKYCNYCQRIRKIEVKEALRKMRLEKAVGPDGFSIEVWKCLGGKGRMIN